MRAGWGDNKGKEFHSNRQLSPRMPPHIPKEQFAAEGGNSFPVCSVPTARTTSDRARAGFRKCGRQSHISRRPCYGSGKNSRDQVTTRRRLSCADDDEEISRRGESESNPEKTVRDEKRSTKVVGITIPANATTPEPLLLASSDDTGETGRI